MNFSRWRRRAWASSGRPQGSAIGLCFAPSDFLCVLRPEVTLCGWRDVQIQELTHLPLQSSWCDRMRWWDVQIQELTHLPLQTSWGDAMRWRDVQIQELTHLRFSRPDVTVCADGGTLKSRNWLTPRFKLSPLSQSQRRADESPPEWFLHYDGQRWEPSNVSLIVRDKVTRLCPQTTTLFFFFFFFDEKGEPNRGPSAYQPNALPLDQTGSHHDRTG